MSYIESNLFKIKYVILFLTRTIQSLKLIMFPPKLLLFFYFYPLFFFIRWTIRRWDNPEYWNNPFPLFWDVMFIADWKSANIHLKMSKLLLLNSSCMPQ